MNKRQKSNRGVGSGRDKAGRVVVENVNVPGWKTNVDAAKYGAMKQALMRILPRRTPGLTQAEMFESVRAHLPQDLFPGGEKAGWWVKTVQLDMEAKGRMIRSSGKPLRWRRT
jgi:hypothetical protein